jgi:hypothetical protein
MDSYNPSSTSSSYYSYNYPESSYDYSSYSTTSTSSPVSYNFQTPSYNQQYQYSNYYANYYNSSSYSSQYDVSLGNLSSPKSLNFSSSYEEQLQPIQPTTSSPQATSAVVKVEFENEILPLINAVKNNSSSNSKRRTRTAFTIQQRKYLLTIFEKSIYPTKDQLEQLSSELNVSASIIQTWFKNMRAKKKKLTKNDTSFDHY